MSHYLYVKHTVATSCEAVVSLNYEVLEGGEQKPQSLKGKMLPTKKVPDRTIKSSFSCRSGNLVVSLFRI